MKIDEPLKRRFGSIPLPFAGARPTRRPAERRATTWPCHHGGKTGRDGAGGGGGEGGEAAKEPGQPGCACDADQLTGVKRPRWPIRRGNNKTMKENRVCINIIQPLVGLLESCQRRHRGKPRVALGRAKRRAAVPAIAAASSLGGKFPLKHNLSRPPVGQPDRLMRVK